MLRQGDKVFSYNAAEFPPIVARLHTTYDGSIFSPNRHSLGGSS
jgi:hypothetical protein